jgi:hypothetical protein
MNRFVAGFLACLLPIAILSAAGKQPTPVVAQQPVAVTVQQPVNVTTDRGTAQNPLIVQKSETADQKATEAAKATSDRWLTWGTVATAIATVLVGVATIIAAVIAKRAADAVPKVERAYVFVTVTRQGFAGAAETNDRTLVIKVHFHNRGRTPAIMRSLRAYVVWGDVAPQALLEHDRANREMPQGLVIASGDEHVETIREPISEEQVRDLTDVVNHAFIVGVLKYEDVWGDRHEVSFCWMSQPQRHNDGLQFVPYPSPLNRFT